MTMEQKESIKQALLREKLIVIIRGVETSQLPCLLNALYQGGIRFAEITFDPSGKIPTEETAACIRRMSEFFRGKLHIGAGTVIGMEQATAAVSAGAEYLISPNVDMEVIRYASEAGVLSLPGALTPTEAETAHRAGADFVKLFPVDALGVGYIKAVCAPLSHIPFVAVGGVNQNNLGDFLRAGAVGVGVGSNIVQRAWIEAGEWDRITALAKTYCDAIRAYDSEGDGI